MTATAKPTSPFIAAEFGIFNEAQRVLRQLLSATVNDIPQPADFDGDGKAEMRFFVRQTELGMS